MGHAGSTLSKEKHALLSDETLAAIAVMPENVQREIITLAEMRELQRPAAAAAAVEVSTPRAAAPSTAVDPAAVDPATLAASLLTTLHRDTSCPRSADQGPRRPPRLG